jgi:1-acyl-sn-glycerol-3-phosphate acyltransferase
VSGLARSAACLAGTGRIAGTTALRLWQAEDDPGNRALFLRDAARQFLDLHRIEVEASGPVPDGPVLLACNHVSWLDPLVVASVVACVPISKAEVAGWPLVGRLARDLGVLFHARGDAHSGARILAEAIRALRAGLPVLNFPEGTTTDGASVRPFRRGLFAVAEMAGVPVVPVAVSYKPRRLAWTGDATFLPHWLALTATPRARVRLRLGAAMAPFGADPGDLARVARAAVQDLLGVPHVPAAGRGLP